MSIVDSIKDQLKISDVAKDYGIELENRGAYWIGECKFHKSKGKQDFISYDNKGFKCLGCGVKGSVFDLVMKGENCDFSAALKKLSIKTGIGLKEMSEEEIEKLNKQKEEEKIIFNIQNEFADYCHKQLDNYKIGNQTIREFEKAKRGFSDETINKLKVGYSDKKETVVKHLLDKFSEEDILKTGLFLKFGNTIKPFFSGRIVYPYIKHNNAVYFIGRLTDNTPKSKFEQGKYKKQRTRNEKRPYISDLVKNKYFYGEDSLNQDYTIITEGVTDCMSLLQAGFSSISPVTVRFRKQDFQKLLGLVKRLKTVYILNDNEKNQAGKKGAIETAKFLFENGVHNVRLCELPRDEAQEKIDVNDYLSSEEPKEANEKIQPLLNESQSIIDFLVDNISDNSSQRAEDIKNCLKLLIDYDEIFIEDIINKIHKKTKHRVTSLQKELKVFRLNKQIEAEEKEKILSEENKKQEKLQQVVDERFYKPDLVKHIWEEIDKTHKLDHKEKLSAFFIRITAELKNPRDRKSAAFKGDSSSGKDNLIQSVLRLFPEKDNKFLTHATAAALRRNITNVKCIAFSEMNVHREEGANSSITETFKQMAEGGISAEICDIKGNVIELKSEQKTLFYGTTDADTDDELETRYVIIPIFADENKNQIVVNSVLDQVSAESVEDFNNNNWVSNSIKALDSDVEVVIPYAQIFKEKIKIQSDEGKKEVYLFDFNQPRIMRDVKRLMSIVKGVAWLHQKQRTIKDMKNKKVLYASPDDFLIAYALFENFFNLTSLGIDARDHKLLDKIKELQGKYKEELIGYKETHKNWVPRKYLLDETGKSLGTIKKTIKRLVNKNLIEAYYEEGGSNSILLRALEGCQKGVKRVSLTVKVPPLNTLLTGYLTPAIKQNIYNNKEKIDNFKHLMALLAEFDGLKKNKKKSVSVFSEVDTHQIDTLKTQKHIEHIKKKQPNTIVQNATVVWGIIKDNYKQSKKPVSYELVKEQSKMEDKEIDEALKFLEPKGDVLEEPAGFFISL